MGTHPIFESDFDCLTGFYDDGSDTLTNVSQLTGLNGSEFASQETIQSVSTITGEHIEINAKGNETLEAFSETEKILKNLSQDAIRCLQSTDDEGSRPESELFEGSEVYEEIESDMTALQISKPAIETSRRNSSSRPNSQHIEDELRYIADQIDNVAENIKRSSSQENILK